MKTNGGKASNPLLRRVLKRRQVMSQIAKELMQRLAESYSKFKYFSSRLKPEAELSDALKVLMTAIHHLLKATETPTSAWVVPDPAPGPVTVRLEVLTLRQTIKVIINELKNNPEFMSNEGFGRLAEEIATHLKKLKTVQGWAHIIAEEVTDEDSAINTGSDSG